MKHEEKEGRGTGCDMCGKITHIKPSWEDMRNGNKVSVNSVVREMLILGALINIKKPYMKRKRGINYLWQE